MEQENKTKEHRERQLDVNPNSIEALWSVRRMELKSKVAFCGGYYYEIGPVALGGSDAIPDPHFNRISVLESDKLDQGLLTECSTRMAGGTPLFIDVPHPASEAVRNLFLQNSYHPTGESRSSMLLTESRDASQGTDELHISLVNPDTTDLFLDLFLRGFDTPAELIPLAMGLFHDLVLRNCHPGNSRLYIGTYRGEPAATLYLFYEGDEGGINMVSTKETLRGKGLATAMMRRSMDDAHELGLKILSLETGWNSPPERLYGRLGFTTIARHEIFTNVPDLNYGL